MKIEKYLEKMGFPLMQIEIIENKSSIMDFLKPTKTYKIGNNIHISQIDDKFELISSHRNSQNDELVFDKIEDAIVTGLQYQVMSNVESLIMNTIDMDSKVKIEYAVSKLNDITELDNITIKAENRNNDHAITISDKEFPKHNRVMYGKGKLEDAKLETATYSSEHTGLQPNAFEYEVIRHLLTINDARLIKKHNKIMKKSELKVGMKP